MNETEINCNIRQQRQQQQQHPNTTHNYRHNNKVKSSQVDLEKSIDLDSILTAIEAIQKS